MRLNVSLRCGQTFLCPPVVAIFVSSISSTQNLLLIKKGLIIPPLNCTKQTTYRKSGVFTDFVGHPLSFIFPIYFSVENNLTCKTKYIKYTLA